MNFLPRPAWKKSMRRGQMIFERGGSGRKRCYESPIFQTLAGFSRRDPGRPRSALHDSVRARCYCAAIRNSTAAGSAVAERTPCCPGAPGPDRPNERSAAKRKRNGRSAGNCRGAQGRGNRRDGLATCRCGDCSGQATQGAHHTHQGRCGGRRRSRTWNRGCTFQGKPEPAALIGAGMRSRI